MAALNGSDANICNELYKHAVMQERYVNSAGVVPPGGNNGHGPCGPGYPANFPVWACNILKPEDIHPQVTERPIILTPKFVGDNIYDEVMAAEAFKISKRIYEKVGLDYPYLSTDHGYAGYLEDLEDLKKNNTGQNSNLKRKFIETKYPHKTIYNENYEPFTIPNPYRARAIREKYTLTDGRVTFASPNTNRYSNEVRAANSALVEAFAFDSLLFDKDMTIAFLASLWHCANPEKGGEKCIPAQVIMRLREFEQFKNQGTKAAAVQYLRGWSTLAKYLKKALRMMESLDMPQASAPAPVVAHVSSTPPPAVAHVSSTPAPAPAAPAPAPAALPPKSALVPLTGLAERLKRLKGFGPNLAAKPSAGFGPQLRYIVPAPAKKAT